VGVTSLYDAIELPLIPVLVDMEWTGIAIDAGVFRGLARDLTSDLERLRVEIANAAGTEFNLNSPKQLAAILFEKLQLPVLKKTKTGPSTDAEVLEQLATMGHEVPRLILEQRELEKLRSTYVDVLPARVNPATGRIHTTFVQAGAATGRIASTDPNLQNIPVRTLRGEAIRRGFVPTAGWRFLAADYSQIELRLLAHFSGDPAFVAAFRQGDDIHRQTAAIIFGVPVAEVTADMRGRAKTINFATIYGQGPFALRGSSASPRMRREPSSRTTSSASPGCARGSTGRWHWGGSRAGWRHCSTVVATFPRSRTRTSTPALSVNGWRRTHRCRDPRRTSSRSQ
jgi:DNA polymerase-1